MQIEVSMQVDSQKGLRAAVTTEREKLNGLKFGETVNVKISSGDTGKWGMAKLWRKWMALTAKYMAGQGCVMPLMIGNDGQHYGQRQFNAEDAHELFTHKWMGADAQGRRKSWSKQSTDEKVAADKGDRFLALQRHEAWATERGITLPKPRESEYCKLEQEQNQ